MSGTADDRHPRLEEVHRRHARWIRARVRALFPKDWEDLVQEVMLKLGQALPRMQEPREEAVRAVVSRTVRSVCVDEMRRRARRPPSVQEDADVVEDVTGVTGRAARNDDVGRLRTRAWPTLDERQRRILKLRFDEGLTFRQIAEILDVPQGSVAGWYSRALDRLREAMG